jgi:hypothetical protein
MVFSAPLPLELENLLALFRAATPGFAGQTGLQSWKDQLKR